MTLTTPGRHAGLFQDRHQRQHGQRRVRGRLEHHRAAGGERRADLARRHRRRKIPRRHQHGDAGRLVLHEDAGAGGRRDRHLADDCAPPPPRTSGRTRPHRRPRRANSASALPFSSVMSLASRSASRMISSKALRRISRALARLPAAQPGERRLRRRRPPPSHPRRWRSPPRRSLLSVAGSMTSKRWSVRGLAPLAADPQIGRHVGEQIVVHGVSLVPCPGCGAAAIRRRDRDLIYSAISAGACRFARGTPPETRIALAAERPPHGLDDALDGRQHHVLENVGRGSGMCGVVMRTGGPSRS